MSVKEEEISGNPSVNVPLRIILLYLAIVCAWDSGAQGQVRGVYPPGMSATNSGVTPEPGFTYANLFLFYARDTLRGASGEITATGRHAVLMDMNSFIWVSKPQAALKGALYSASATLPIANNSLTSDEDGAISGGGGFADSYYQPLILGWRNGGVNIRAIYGFLAPTGRFDASANDNVGSGYWTNVLSGGETVYLTKDKATAISAFEMYEFHATQQGTKIHPGETFDLDYSLTHVLPLRRDLSLQLGMIGYGQYQTTDTTGPNIAPGQGTAHYKVNALGVSSSVTLPARKVNAGFKFFKEFSNESTFQGYSVQMSIAISF